MRICSAVSVLILSLCVVVVGSAAATAQIAVFDIQLIDTESTAWKAVIEKVQGYTSTRQALISRRESEINKAQQDLAAQRAILAPDAFANRGRDIERQIGELQGDANRLTRQLQQSVSDARKKFEAALLDVVKELATEKKYELVLIRNASTAYVGKSFDVTAELVKRLNRKLPTLAIQLPAD